MGKAVGEDKPRPFHERFDIEIEMDDAKRRFINRVINEAFDYLREEFALAIRIAMSTTTREER